MFKKMAYYFRKPIRLVVLNGLLLACAIILNLFWQVFCIPSTFATLVISICFLNIIFYPILIQYKKLHVLLGLINGISFFVFIYCILFLGVMNWYGFVMILMGIGLITFVPHFFVIQILWKSLIKPVSKTIRLAFITALIGCFIGVIYIGFQYNKAIADVDAVADSNLKNLEANYWNEKILGMHFIYHTEFCEYDGWRPPINEPILVIGMWLNGGVDPLNVSLKERVELYKYHFPENTIHFDCSCASEYSDSYKDDELFN